MFQQFNAVFFIFIFVLSVLSCATDADKKNAQKTAEGSSISPADKPVGLLLFRQNCTTCHGAEGKLGLNGAKDLSQSTLPIEERIAIITKGKGLMTPFGTMLGAEQINAVAEYTLTLKSAQVDGK